MTPIDTSTEAVERLALDHQAVGNNPDTLIMSHPHHWKTAAVLRQLVKERDEARARLATPAPDAVQEAAIDIAAIENGGKRWHGEDHRVVAVRWEPYKPDGQRQMKAKGRWQEQVGSGDYWRWQNCDRPAAARAEQIEKGEL